MRGKMVVGLAKAKIVFKYKPYSTSSKPFLLPILPPVMHKTCCSTFACITASSSTLLGLEISQTKSHFNIKFFPFLLPILLFLLVLCAPCALVLFPEYQSRQQACHWATNLQQHISILPLCYRTTCNGAF